MYENHLCEELGQYRNPTPFFERVRNRITAALSDAGKRGLTAVILINVIFVGFFLVMSCNTELYGDDYGYMYVFDKAVKITDNRVDSFGEVLRSQAAHYSLMNGRSVAHTLLQWALMHGHGFFCVVNTLMYMMLGVGMYQHARSSADRKAGKHRPFVMLLVYMLPWLVFPDYGNVYYIASIAANYLWTMAIIVWFLLPFRLLFEERDPFVGDMTGLHGFIRRIVCIFTRDRYTELPFAPLRREKVFTVIMALFGIAAGWCSENGSAAALFILGCMGLFYILMKHRIPTWCYAGFGGALFGFIMLLCAPGYDIRLENSESTGFFNRLTTLISAHTMMPYGCIIFILMLCAAFLLRTRINTSPDGVLRFAAPCSVAAVFSMIINIISAGHVIQAYLNLFLCIPAVAYVIFLLRKLPKEKRFGLRTIIPAAYLITALVANLALLAVPYVQRRSQMPFMVFFTIGASILFDRTLSRMCSMLKLKGTRRLITIAAASYAFISLFVVSIRTDLNYRNFEQMEQSIYDQKINGVSEVIIERPDMSRDRRVAALFMTNNDPEYWINRAFCEYYGISSVYYEAAENGSLE